MRGETGAKYRKIHRSRPHHWTPPGSDTVLTAIDLAVIAPFVVLQSAVLGSVGVFDYVGSSVVGVFNLAFVALFAGAIWHASALRQRLVGTVFHSVLWDSSQSCSDSDIDSGRLIRAVGRVEEVIENRGEYTPVYDRTEYRGEALLRGPASCPSAIVQVSVWRERIRDFVVLTDQGQRILVRANDVLFWSPEQRDNLGRVAEREQLPPEVEREFNSRMRQFRINYEASLRLGDKIEVYGSKSEYMDPQAEGSYRQGGVGVALCSDRKRPVVILRPSPRD